MGGDPEQLHSPVGSDHAEASRMPEKQGVVSVKKDHKDRDRSRERSRRSRSRERSKRKDRSRSRSRDRRHKKRSSRSRERRSSRRESSRSRSRDRHRSSSHRHGKSSSRRSRSRSQSPSYGGYQPRKRHDGDPPPKPAAMAGPNLAIPTAGPGSSNDPYAFLRQSTAPMDQNEALRLWQEQQLQARQLVLAQQAASAAQAATKTQREIYVGNLTAGLVTDAALRQVFNGALMAAFPGSNMPGMEPVVNVSLHSDGRYAFVELRSPDMATAALQLNGAVQLMGQSIAVNRPSGYVDPMKAHAAALNATQALAAFKSGDPAGASLLTNSLVNLPAAAGLLRPPGNLLTLPGPPGLPGVIPGAMPGFPFGLPGAVPGMPTVATAAAYAAPAVAQPQPVIRGASASPTHCLCVTGMVTADVLQDDEEYEDVRDELQDECNRHAANSVVAVKVPRPPPEQRGNTAFMGVGDYGKAFVQFKDVASAHAARSAIHGRLFAGVTVNVAYITPEAFAEAAGGA